MDQVQCKNISVLAKVLPPHRDSLLSAIIYQLHKFDVNSPQHALAVESLQTRLLLMSQSNPDLSNSDLITLLADLLYRRIDVYVEDGPLLMYQNTLSCRGTVKIVQRTSRKITRNSNSPHYDAYVHKIKRIFPNKSDQSHFPATINVMLPFYIFSF